jgi:predicted MPP superfamily phosphohydrolase
MPYAVLSLALHLYLGWRLVPAWLDRPLAAAGLVLVLLASLALMPLSLRASRMRSPRAAAALTWGGLLCLGLFSSLFVLSVLRDAALLSAALVNLALPDALPLARLSVASGRAVPVLAALVTAWGYFNARRTAAVVTVDVPIRGLPPALHGFTIAQISDVHVGPTIRGEYVQAIVASVNRLEADMVAITGDLVDGRVQDLAPHVAPLADLRSRHGTYFVTGNHEYYSGAAPWIRELERLGMRVLLNEHVVLRREDATLLVAGVTDWSAHRFDPAQRSDPQAALAGAPDEAVKLLLAHQPRSAHAAERAGFHLLLSGHTHGGQFWPWNHFVRWQQPYTAGLHRVRELWVYVSRGTGYWGPPKRVGAPSEITRVRLVRTA